MAYNRNARRRGNYTSHVCLGNPSCRSSSGGRTRIIRNSCRIINGKTEKNYNNNNPDVTGHCNIFNSVKRTYRGGRIRVLRGGRGCPLSKCSDATAFDPGPYCARRIFITPTKNRAKLSIILPEHRPLRIPPLFLQFAHR